MRTAFYLLAPLLGVLFAAAGFELGLRAFHPVPFASPENLYFEPDPWTGYRIRPHSVGSFRSPVGGAPIEARTNSHGLRDTETSLAKAPGQTRVLALGDSMTLGVGVRQQDAWPEVLERLLRERFGNGIEVIAAGVSGWGPFQYAQYYEHVGRLFEPDWVLVGFFVGNDAFSRAHSLGELPTAFYGTRVALGARPEGLSLLPRAGVVLYEHSHYARLLLNRWRRAFTADALATGTGDEPRDNDRLPPAYLALQTRKLSSLERDDERRRARAANSVAQMARLARAAAADGVRFRVALLPDENQVNRALFELLVSQRDPSRYDRSMPQSMLLDLLARAGIEAIDLLPAIRASKRRLYLNDSHWRPEGHRVAAQVLADALSADLAAAR